jgi:hypothetical protein
VTGAIPMLDAEHLALLREVLESIEGLRLHVDQVNHALALEVEVMQLKLNKIIGERRFR